jgi:glucosamine--fructose-6-phosphate aminotransferase (isomerizing)
MSSFALQREMHEAPGILRRFDEHALNQWLPVLQQQKKILLTGEGSSRIFPAHNTIAHALQRNSPLSFVTAGAREALQYDLRDTAIIGTSNSGRTRELVDLFIHAKSQNVPCFAITATADSPVTQIADDSFVLSCGREQAVAASKSVFEQALTYQALLHGFEWSDKHRAADLCEKLLHKTIAQPIIDQIAAASTLYIAGRNDGVAEELVLKATEIVRTKAIYLEGTYLLHGVEEVLQPNDALILIEPFSADFDKINTVIAHNTHIPIVAIAAGETPFPTLSIPRLAGFDSYFQLLAGWTVLVAAALQNGIDLDHTRRARKSGNAV